MSRLSETVDVQLKQIADFFESSQGELTGKVIYREGTREIDRRIGGSKALIPEVKHLKQGPGAIAAAIRRGRGKVYRDVRGEVERYWAGKVPKERKPRVKKRPSVEPHSGRSYCVHCRDYHSKGQHRSHGEGSFHRTHLFSFNPPDDEKKPALFETEKETRAHVAGKRNIHSLKAGKVFDEDRLVRSELFQGRGGPQKSMFGDNPRRGKSGLVYGRKRCRKCGGMYKTATDSRTKQTIGSCAVCAVQKLFSKRKCQHEYFTENQNGDRQCLRCGLKRKGNPGDFTKSRTSTATRTATSTKAHTSGNITVTGGAGRGATTSVTVRRNPRKAQLNPRGGVQIYGRVVDVTAVKGPGHRCDAKCKAYKHTYRHGFKTGVEAIGLKNGTVLLRPRKR